MADSLLLFDVFGNHGTRKSEKSIVRQPLSNENMGKAVLEGPVKPNEPLKKSLKPGEPKKSFLSNAGKTLQGTPARQMFSPKVARVNPIIYMEEKDEGICLEEIEFTKPPQRDNTYIELLESSYEKAKGALAPATPPPKNCHYSMNYSTDDENNFSDFSIDSLQDEDLGLPDPY